jgi:hypothetical protein
MTTTTMTSVNGIDIEALAQPTDAMKKTPRLAALQFRSVTDWKDGAVSVTTFAGYAKGETGVTRSKPHTLAADEPPALLGTGTQVGPTGHLLHALSHSLAVTIANTQRTVDIATMTRRAEWRARRPSPSVGPGYNRDNISGLPLQDSQRGTISSDILNECIRGTTALLTKSR